jgi:Tol biopolymer transport system component
VALAEIREESESGSGVAVTPGPAPRRRPRWLWPAVAALSILVAGLLGWRLSRSTAPPAPLATTTPLTSSPGLELYPAFSPDGRQVAFAWNGEGQNNFDIYVQLIGSGAPLRLTTNPAPDVSPAWSPDGRHIAFVRIPPTGAAEVLLVPALGGAERRLTTTLLAYRGVPPSWRADGKWLAVLGRPSSSEPNAVFLVDIETGERRRMTNPPPLSSGDNGPVFSPDGNTLAFPRFVGTGFASDLWLLSLDPDAKPRGEPRRLTSEGLALSGLDWSPDGRSLIVACDRAGAQALWRLPTTEGSPAWERLPFGANASQPAVARQGGRLAYASIVSDTNLYRLSGSGPPVKLCSSTRFDGSPRFSPDGQRFVFASDRSGSREMWACDAAGANAVQLTTRAGPQAGSPRWSPDGRSVAFDDFQDGHWHILLVGADGGPSRRLTTEAFDHVRPAWSSDGRWIYFGSRRSGQEQIWKMPSVGGPAAQVTRNGGWDSMASPDGRYVYYAQRSQPGIWRVSVEGGEEAKVLDRGRQGRWAVTAQGLYLADTTAEGVVFVERFPLDGGSSVRVAELPKGSVFASVPALTVSPDGRTILLAMVDETESDILLVENFR